MKHTNWYFTSKNGNKKAKEKIGPGALLNSSSEEVVNFDKVLKKIING